jgi:hypothetical protein
VKIQFQPIDTAPRDGREIIILTISDKLYRATPKKSGGWVDQKEGRFADDGAIVGWIPVPDLPDGFERIEGT